MFLALAFPETHRKGVKIERTFGLMMGFVAVMPRTWCWADALGLW